MNLTCTKCNNYFLATADTKDEALCYNCRPASTTTSTSPIPPASHRRRRTQQQSFNPEREHGLRNIIIGGAIMLVGILVTVVTYALASESATGGYFIVAWGAIVFGGIRLVRGILQLLG